MKKAIIIIFAVILIPTILFAILGVPHSVPDEFVVPTDNVKCGESMVMTMINKGLPDEIYFDRLGSVFVLSLTYNDETVMGLQTECHYGYIGNDRVNNLSSISYCSEPENFKQEEFIKTELKLFEDKLGEKFFAKEPVVEEFDDGEKLYTYEYIYSEDNNEERIMVFVSDCSVEMKIWFVY